MLGLSKDWPLRKNLPRPSWGGLFVALVAKDYRGLMISCSFRPGMPIEVRILKPPFDRPYTLFEHSQLPCPPSVAS